LEITDEATWFLARHQCIRESRVITETVDWLGETM